MHAFSSEIDHAGGPAIHKIAKIGAMFSASGRLSFPKRKAQVQITVGRATFRLRWLRAHDVPAWMKQAEIMTNIIQLKDYDGASSAYRLYDVGRTGREGAGCTLRARTDTEAKALALKLLGDHPIELWDRTRFIARYWPGNLPMAISIEARH